jgi:hypothetical protein
LILFNDFQIIKVNKSRHGLITTGNNKPFMAMDTFGDNFRKMTFNFGNRYVLHSEPPVVIKKMDTADMTIMTITIFFLWGACQGSHGVASWTGCLYSAHIGVIKEPGVIIEAGERRL